MSYNKKIKDLISLNESYYSGHETIDKKNFKSVSRELCRSYKNGSLPENIFLQLIEHLLAYYIEHDLEEKLSSKSYIFEEKINKIRPYQH